MNTKIYGFVGVESFDVVHFLGSTLKGLGYRLTVVDYSPLGDVVYTVPGYNGSVKEMEYNDLLIYRAVDLSEVPETEFLLLYFGMNVKHPLISKCDEIWMFSDSQLQKIHALCTTGLHSKQPRFVVFRDKLLTRTTRELIINEFSQMNVNDSNFIELDDDTNSLNIQFRIQYDSKILYRGISATLVSLVTNILETDFELKDIKSVTKGVLSRK